MWDAVLTNPVVAKQMAALLVDGLAVELGIPARFIRVIRFYLGSLVAEVAITRNETYPISDSQIASGLNNNDVYAQVLQLYTNVTGDVSVGLLEPVVLVQVLPPAAPVCSEVCIGLCSGASVLVASAAFSLWYIFCYANNTQSQKRKKRQLRSAGGAQNTNEPLEHSSDSDATDSEPFNETVLPPNDSQVREPFEEVFEERDERRDNVLDASNPFGAPDEARHSAFDYSSPYGGPGDEDFSPRPARPTGEIEVGDRIPTTPTSPKSRSTSSVNINPPSVFEQ